jgi:hypothetical protein
MAKSATIKREFESKNMLVRYLKRRKARLYITRKDYVSEI